MRACPVKPESIQTLPTMGNKIEQAYQLARERYAALGVNTDNVLKQLARVPVR